MKLTLWVKWYMLDSERVFFLCKRYNLFKTCTFLYVDDVSLG